MKQPLFTPTSTNRVAFGSARRISCSQWAFSAQTETCAVRRVLYSSGTTFVVVSSSEHKTSPGTVCGGVAGKYSYLPATKVEDHWRVEVAPISKLRKQMNARVINHRIP